MGTTFAFLKGRPYAPQGAAWNRALEQWRSLASDPGARFDKEVVMDVNELAPMVTWGNSPEDAAGDYGSGSRPRHRFQHGATHFDAARD